jgi:hypothetical protein
MSFELRSAFANGGPIPRKYTCDGEDISPSLLWSNAPEDTQSFALIADDPDAPISTWTHWLLYNLRLEYTPTRFTVYVDGYLEIDITGNFGQGRWAFYDFSQLSVYFINPYVESLCVPVTIDIKPGSDPNCFNNDGNGVIPVAILGSADFDVTLIDPSTIALEGLAIKAVGKASKLLAHIEDVNGDGFDDLVVQIQDEDGAFTNGSGTATVSGNLYDGTLFAGSDSICIVPPE